MNISLDRIAEEGYEPVGIPALFNIGFPLQASGEKIIDRIAKRSIEELNPELEYVGAAIFTYSPDEKWAKKVLGWKISLKEHLHLATIIPLKEKSSNPKT